MNVQAPGSAVNVSVQSIIDQLHKRYGRLTASLMQEVSELQCAVDAQSDELTELRAKFSAVAGAGAAPREGLGIFDDLTRRGSDLVIDPMARKEN